MNKIYKVIWSEVRNCYIVVSELAKRHAKSKGTHISGTGLIASALIVGSLSGVPGSVCAETVATDVDVVKIVLEEDVSQVIVGPGAVLPRNAAVVMPMMLAGTREGTEPPITESHFFSWNVGGTPHTGGASSGNYNNDGAKGKWDIVIGPDASTSGDKAEGNVVIGKDATTKKYQNMGFTPDTKGAVVVGRGSSAEGISAIAIGGGNYGPAGILNAPAIAKGQSSIAIGSAETDGEEAISIGAGSAAKKQHTVAVGRSAKATHSSATALGGNAEATGELSAAIGFDSHASGKWSIAMGQKSKAEAQDSMAFGQHSQVAENAKYGIAIGNYATVDTPDSSTYNYHAVAIGASSHAQGQSSLALGASNYSASPGSTPTGAIGDYSLAMMHGSKALEKDAIAVGHSSVAQKESSIALGSGSVADRAKGEQGYDPLGRANLPQGLAWKSNQAALSIGNLSGPSQWQVSRQITGVAAGSADTDAVNVAQLKALQSAVPDAVHYVSINASHNPPLANFNNDGAKQYDSVAIGGEASSNAIETVAIGSKAEIKSNDPHNVSAGSVAIGQNSKVYYSQYSVALGKQAEVGTDDATKNADNSISIGYQSKALDKQSVSIGGIGTRSGKYGTSIGAFAETILAQNGEPIKWGTAVGYNSKVQVNSGVALGSWSTANVDKGVKGYDPFTNSPHIITAEEQTKIDQAKAAMDVAWETYQNAPSNDNWHQYEDFVAAKDNYTKLFTTWESTEGTVSVGASVEENGKRMSLRSRQITNVAAGTEDTDAVNVAQLKALNSKLDSNAIHYFSVDGDDSAAPDGMNWKNDGAKSQNAMAIGRVAEATGIRSIALGNHANSVGDDTIAIGHDARIISHDVPPAAGANAQTHNWNYSSQSIAIGRGTRVLDSQGAIAIGMQAEAGTEVAEGDEDNKQDFAIAIGYQSASKLEHGISIGSLTNSGKNGIAIGAWSNTEKAAEGVALGYNSSVTKATGVALGSRSIASTGARIIGYDPAGADHANDGSGIWKSQLAAVSVGDSTKKLTRQITNVAAGTEDTDAVNVAQLKRLSNQVIENKTHYYSVNTNPPIPELPNYNNDGAEAVLGLAAGASVKTKGIASTATGTFLRIEGNGDALKFQGATASTYGAFNKIGAKDGVKYDGVANSVIGVANMTENANAALIFGAGNKITNSYRPVTGVEENEAKAALIAAAGGDNSAMIELLQNAVKESGGAVLAVGGANMADYAQLSKLVGVGNKLSGTENEISAYNMIDGYLNEASNVNHLTMIGTGNNVTNGEYNIVIGDGRKLTGASSQDKIKNNIILGSSTGDALLETTVSDVVVIGNNANATVAGGIALGSGSIADTGAGKTGFDVAGGDHANDTTGVWKATAAAVSIGTAADPTGQERITRQITNVAAGTEETDAVNVAQLKAVSASLADKGLDFQGDDGVAIHKDLGETLDIVGGADPEKLTDNNIGVVHEDGQLVVKLAQNIDLTAAGSVTIGDTVVNNDGLTINGGPTITKTNVTMGGQQIHNVAAGTEETDAVNVSQLNTAVAGATTEVKAGNNIAVAKNIADDGHIVYTVHGKDTTVSTSDTSLTVTAEDKGNGLTNYDIKLNNVVTVGNAPATQVQIDGTTGTVNGLTNKTWDPDNITSGQAATEDQLQSVSASFSNKGLDFQGDDGTAVHKNLGETLNIVGGADPAKLTNNNIGVVHEDGQLVVKLAKNVNLGADGSVTTGNTTINNNGLTINNGPSVTNEGINAGNKKITNVAAGTIAPDSTDAVNGSQLYDTNQMITNIGDNINRLGNRVDKVGAGAAALAAMHPLDFDPDDKWNISAGYGNYKGSHAGAVGAFYRPDENTMFSIGASLGNGENMINAGVTIALDRKSRITTSRTAMAREIMDLRKEITELKAARANGNWMLDPEMTKLFPDVPENHWAYEYVAKLAGNGIIEGYPDGNFAGNRMMTRYEFAALLYRAMEKGANVDARALKEFAPEMGRIRVDRVYGKDNDRNKVERVRVNNENAQERDRYGSKIQAAAK